MRRTCKSLLSYSFIGLLFLPCTYASILADEVLSSFNAPPVADANAMDIVFQVSVAPTIALSFLDGIAYCFHHSLVISRCGNPRLRCPSNLQCTTYYRTVQWHYTPLSNAQRSRKFGFRNHFQ